LAFWELVLKQTATNVPAVVILGEGFVALITQEPVLVHPFSEVVKLYVLGNKPVKFFTLEVKPGGVEVQLYV
jgi:hypothetical protein